MYFHIVEALSGNSTIIENIAKQYYSSSENSLLCNYNGGESVMATFTIVITETNYGFVEIEASDAETAFKMAEDAFHDGKTNWGSADLCIGAPIQAT